MVSHSVCMHRYTDKMKNEQPSKLLCKSMVRMYRGSPEYLKWYMHPMECLLTCKEARGHCWYLPSSNSTLQFRQSLTELTDPGQLAWLVSKP